MSHKNTNKPKSADLVSITCAFDAYMSFDFSYYLEGLNQIQPNLHHPY